MTTIDVSSYKKLYLETAKEYSDALSRNYITISQNPLDKNALKNMYISAHSLKSESHVMGYIKMETLSGMIERIIKNILDNNTKIQDSLMVVIKEAIENIQQSLKSVEAENKEKDIDVITKKLEKYNEQFYETHYS